MAMRHWQVEHTGTAFTATGSENALSGRRGVFISHSLSLLVEGDLYYAAPSTRALINYSVTELRLQRERETSSSS